MKVDLNCDMGEGSAVDSELMPLITSANIACGGHAGDEQTMRASIRLAIASGAGIGAHPSYPDRDGFGRRPMSISPAQVRDAVADQIRALADLAAASGASLQHVKPHGTLYNQAASDHRLAEAIGEAIAQIDPALIVVALAGTDSVEVFRQMGLRVAREGFVDRGYTRDGRLVSRDLPGALVTSPHAAAARAVRLVRDHRLTAVDGTDLEIVADTLCIHSDTPQAGELAVAVRTALEAAGVVVAPLAVTLIAQASR